MPGESNNLDRRTAKAGSYVFSNGILPWKRLPSQFLVNHSHFWGLVCLLARERTSLQKRDSQGAEMIAANPVHICDSQFVFGAFCILRAAEPQREIPHE